MEGPGKILQWNLRGIRARRGDLQLLLHQENPDFLCLQELKVPDSESNYNLHRLYESYLKLPQDNVIPKGGTMISVKKTIAHSLIHLNTPLQAVAINLHSGNLRSLCSLYLPPGENLTERQILQMIDQLPTPTLIVGDFNAHSPTWYDINQDQRGSIIERIIEQKNLALLNNNSPTYYRSFDQVASHIDLALIDAQNALDFSWKVLEDLYGSDHFPIIISPINHTPATVLEKWKTNEADWALFRDLAAIPEEAENQYNTEDAYNFLRNHILEAAHQAIPRTKTNNRMRPPLPWWNKECGNLRRTVRSAYRRMRRRHNPTTVMIYRRQLALKNRTYKKARIDSWRAYVSGLTARTPSSKIWKKIRKIRGKYTPRPIPTLQINGNLVQSEREVADAFADHYSSISTRQPIQPLPRTDNTPLTNELPYNKEFTLRELNGAIRETKLDGSPGEDQIQNSMLKRLPNSTKNFMLTIFNRIWTEGIFPTDWRSSLVIPILKPGKDSSDIKNYRPISLNSCICKVFERMVCKRLAWQLETNQGLSPHQYGFRPQRSTMEPIAILTTDILNGFASRRPARPPKILNSPKIS